MRTTLFLSLLLLTTVAFSQTIYKSIPEVYSFQMPDSYKNQSSTNPRNEFVFVNTTDSTSLVVSVTDRTINDNFLKGFKAASNEEIEKNIYRVLTSPKIVKRGEVSNYKEQSIYFHVAHRPANEAETNYMMNYLFYNRDKEINFIFKTKESKLPKVLPTIEAIVNSVKLL